MAPSALNQQGLLHIPHDDTKDSKRPFSPWVDASRGSRPAELFHDKTAPSCQTSGTIGEHEFKIEQSCASKKYEENNVLLTAFQAAQYRLNGALDANMAFQAQL